MRVTIDSLRVERATYRRLTGHKDIPCFHIVANTNVGEVVVGRFISVRRARRFIARALSCLEYTWDGVPNRHQHVVEGGWGIPGDMIGWAIDETILGPIEIPA